MPTELTPLEWDWTRAGGRSNSADEFHRLCAEVERLIRDDAHMLLRGRADRTAGLIMAQLAHKQNVGPLHGLSNYAIGVLRRHRPIPTEGTFSKCVWCQHTWASDGPLGGCDERVYAATALGLTTDDEADRICTKEEFVDYLGG